MIPMVKLAVCGRNNAGNHDTAENSLGNENFVSQGLTCLMYPMALLNTEAKFDKIGFMEYK